MCTHKFLTGGLCESMPRWLPAWLGLAFGHETTPCALCDSVSARKSSVCVRRMSSDNTAVLPNKGPCSKLTRAAERGGAPFSDGQKPHTATASPADAVHCYDGCQCMRRSAQLDSRTALKGVRLIDSSKN